MSKDVLQGQEWRDYLEQHPAKPYLEEYKCTHNYEQIFKRGDYYYAFSIFKGYKNLAALKRLV